jgi:hypothetical protein
MLQIVVLSEFCGFTQRKFLVQMQAFHLAVIEEEMQRPLNENESLHEEANVELIFYLLSAIFVSLHCLRLNLESQGFQGDVTNVSKEFAKVKSVGIQGLVLIVRV